MILLGYWLFHCHISFHIEVGMALVFKIGEHSDFPPVPKNFPTCGDWLTPIEEEEISVVQLEKEWVYLLSQGGPFNTTKNKAKIITTSNSAPSQQSQVGWIKNMLTLMLLSFLRKF